MYVIRNNVIEIMAQKLRTLDQFGGVFVMLKRLIFDDPIFTYQT